MYANVESRRLSSAIRKSQIDYIFRQNRNTLPDRAIVGSRRIHVGICIVFLRSVGTGWIMT